MNYKELIDKAIKNDEVVKLLRGDRKSMPFS